MPTLNTAQQTETYLHTKQGILFNPRDMGSILRTRDSDLIHQTLIKEEEKFFEFINNEGDTAIISVLISKTPAAFEKMLEIIGNENFFSFIIRKPISAINIILNSELSNAISQIPDSAWWHYLADRIMRPYRANWIKNNPAVNPSVKARVDFILSQINQNFTTPVNVVESNISMSNPDDLDNILTQPCPPEEINKFVQALIQRINSNMPEVNTKKEARKHLLAKPIPEQGLPQGNYTNPLHSTGQTLAQLAHESLIAAQPPIAKQTAHIARTELDRCSRISVNQAQSDPYTVSGTAHKATVIAAASKQASPAANTQLFHQRQTDSEQNQGHLVTPITTDKSNSAAIMSKIRDSYPDKAEEIIQIVQNRVKRGIRNFEWRHLKHFGDSLSVDNLLPVYGKLLFNLLQSEKAPLQTMSQQAQPLSTCTIFNNGKRLLSNTTSEEPFSKRARM